MRKKANKNLTSLADFIDEQYGKRGTAKREKFETEFEVLERVRSPGILRQQIENKKAGLTTGFFIFQRKYYFPDLSFLALTSSLFAMNKLYCAGVMISENSLSLATFKASNASVFAAPFVI